MMPINFLHPRLGHVTWQRFFPPLMYDFTFVKIDNNYNALNRLVMFQSRMREYNKIRWCALKNRRHSMTLYPWPTSVKNGCKLEFLLVLVAPDAEWINLSPPATFWRDDHPVSDDIYLPLPQCRDKLFPSVSLSFATDKTPVWIYTATQ